MGADPKYNFGQLGLNLVASPLHLPDGTLIQAQNVEIINEEGVGGLGSRAGIAALNDDTLGGAIVAMFNIPLDTDGITPPSVPLQAFFGAIINGGADFGWLTTDDATIFNESAAPAALAFGGSGSARPTSNAAATFNSKMYYVVGFGSSGVLWSWDGVTNTSEVSSWPAVIGFLFGGVYNVIAGPDGIFISTLYVEDPAAVNNRIYVFKYDGALLTQVGDEIALSGINYAPAGFAYVAAFDLLFVGEDDDGDVGASNIYAVDPSVGGAWTNEETLAAGLRLQWMASFEDELYVAAAGTDTVIEGKVLVRDLGGTYTDSFVGPTDDTFQVGPLIEFDGDLYVCWSDQVTPQQRIYRFSTGAWSLDADLVALFTFTGAEFAGVPIVVASCLLWPWLSGGILKRTTAAVWSIAAPPTNLTTGDSGAIEV